jgi:hypothetical protein
MEKANMKTSFFKDFQMILRLKKSLINGTINAYLQYEYSWKDFQTYFYYNKKKTTCNR